MRKDFRIMKIYYNSKILLLSLLFDCIFVNVVTSSRQQQQQQQLQKQYYNLNDDFFLENYNNLSSAQYQKNYYEKINTNGNNINNHGCMSNRLVFYKVVLHTYWTRDLFPKHYPDWRPSAQWTKTLGRSHNSNYSLFHIGQQALQGVKEFVETGKTNILENTQPYYTLSDSLPPSSLNSHSSSTSSSTLSSSLLHSSSVSTTSTIQLQQNEGGILDEFNIPPILSGEGRSEGKFFADDNHSLVSLITRIVPSPDWFIGVDSFQLCIDGKWIDTVTLEMDPLDAGTDNGFTFTAPNWPTNPQGVIYRITSKYPSHPAGSFFYPKSKRLPPIATFQFIKVKEYELSEVFHIETDENNYETIKTQTHLESEHNHNEINNELSASIERERQNEIIQNYSIPYTKKDRIRAKMLAKINPLTKNLTTAPETEIVTEATTSTSPTRTMITISDNKIIFKKNDKNAIINSIGMNYTKQRKHNSNSRSSSRNIMKNRKQHQKRVNHKSKNSSDGTSNDCRVGHWSNWGPCNKTCGIGEMRRYRKVLKYAKRGGRQCPPLQQSKWCGTGRSCLSSSDDTSFNWSSYT